MPERRRQVEAWGRGWIAGLLLVGLTAGWSLGFTQAMGDVPSQYLALRGGALVAPLLPHEPWRLLTAGLMHVELTHLLVNALGLVVLSVVLGRAIGAVGVLGVFTGAMITGALGSALLTGGWSLGASGGVFGLMGACLSAGWRRPQLRDWLWRGASVWLAGLLVLLWRGGAEVDHAAHLAGAIAGFGLGFPRGARPRWTGGALAAVCLGLALSATQLHGPARFYSSDAPWSLCPDGHRTDGGVAVCAVEVDGLSDRLAKAEIRWTEPGVAGQTAQGFALRIFRDGGERAVVVLSAMGWPAPGREAWTEADWRRVLGQ